MRYRVCIFSYTGKGRQTLPNKVTRYSTCIGRICSSNNDFASGKNRAKLRRNDTRNDHGFGGWNTHEVPQWRVPLWCSTAANRWWPNNGPNSSQTSPTQRPIAVNSRQGPEPIATTDPRFGRPLLVEPRRPTEPSLPWLKPMRNRQVRV